MTKTITTLFLAFYSVLIFGQDYIITDSLQQKYTFINWKANTIKHADSAITFQKLYKKLDNIYHNKAEKLHVFHIGGSHIQADFYSNRLRHYLQNISDKAKGQRGFIYPYRMAKTNNPLNYKVTFDGEWKGYRCSRNDSVAWGLSGVSAKFKDSISNITIKANYKNYSENTYDFNKLRVFYDEWSDDYDVIISDASLVTSQTRNSKAHYIEFILNTTVNELDICIKKTTTSATSEFLMMGLELMNDNPGIEYTTIGVNGASFAFYNRAAYFEEQLLLYKPDLFIISVGTNDTYTLHFNAEQYKIYYEQLILTIQKANPDCAILLTTPNDSYYKKQFANPNTKIAAQVIYELSEKYHMAVWDLYEIMGGYVSSQKWYNNKLMPKDRIHFTRKGYDIKADLLLQALVHAWEQEMNYTPNSILNSITKKSSSIE
jgi:lysophospholipase L1-like esterase